MTGILIVILLTIETLELSAGFGWLLGERLRPQRTKTPPPTPEQLLKQQRAMREMRNFFAYDGSEQSKGVD